MQMLKDFDNAAEVNTQLEKMCVFGIPRDLYNLSISQVFAKSILGDRYWPWKFSPFSFCPSLPYSRGYNIGIRLIDDFLANSGAGKCATLKDTADVIAKTAFKSFLGVTATVSSFDEKKQDFTLLLEDNPLADFVELPEEYKDTLSYSNILCGVIRGALEMVQMRVECSFTKDALRGDDITELKVHLIEIMKEDMPNDE